MALLESNQSAAPVPLPGQRTGPEIATALCSFLSALAMVEKAKNSILVNHNMGEGKRLCVGWLGITHP